MSAPIRTLMFASANDPVRSLKAIAIGASAVCLDLEDAVATSEKAAAREVVAQTLLDPSVGLPDAAHAGLATDALRRPRRGGGGRGVGVVSLYWFLH